MYVCVYGCVSMCVYVFSCVIWVGMCVQRQRLMSGIFSDDLFSTLGIEMGSLELRVCWLCQCSYPACFKESLPLYLTFGVTNGLDIYLGFGDLMLLQQIYYPLNHLLSLSLSSKRFLGFQYLLLTASMIDHVLKSCMEYNFFCRGTGWLEMKINGCTFSTDGSTGSSSPAFLSAGF